MMKMLIYANMQMRPTALTIGLNISPLITLLYVYT